MMNFEVQAVWFNHSSVSQKISMNLILLPDISPGDLKKLFT